MKNAVTEISQILSLLEGTWTGQGRGEFPGVTSFDYRENFVLTRRDEKSLAYEQRTQKRYDGRTEWLMSHWENGFIRLLDNGVLELTSAQIGRTEVLVGAIETSRDVIHIHFASKTITNDPRMVSSSRTFELEGDTLRYEMKMHTTKVERLRRHLKIALQRAR